MLKSLKAKGLSALPYLETSALMAAHGGQVKFSARKPNVIVGPNGAGKSALLRAISLRFLAHLTPRSALNDDYVVGCDSDAWWVKEREGGQDFTFLKGLDVTTDGGPVLFYRPGHLPGNEADVTHAMMMGYFEEAEQFVRMTEKKSSGQMSQALLAEMLNALAGRDLPTACGFKNWRFGKEPRPPDRACGHFSGPSDFDYKAEALRKLSSAGPDAKPLVLMDEPEQSLDALAEAQLWAAIAGADCSQLQVIVATHSVYPMLHPKRFNLIEAEVGYAKKVLDLLS
jgi:energy-coupling factor transporter ATP-binding protein EcfA2